MIKQLSTNIIYQNQWLTLREDQVDFGQGHQGIYSVVEKSDFALIIPFDGTYLHLVDQERYALKQRLLQFPQGSHELDPSTSPEQVAAAELQEELGLLTQSLTRIGFMHEAPGYSNQGFYIYLATELSVGTSQPELSEGDLIHRQLTVAEFEQLVVAGKISDAPTVAAFGLARMKGVA